MASASSWYGRVNVTAKSSEEAGRRLEADEKQKEGIIVEALQVPSPWPNANLAGMVI